MEDSSILSGETSNPCVDISESFSSCHEKKIITEFSLPASKFKGVVSQQNGHWGAQIYANHQRIWLGTFRSEKEAAMAYDSASIKLRNEDSHRNFPWNEMTFHEPNFQSHFTTEAILNMIKDGSYTTKFFDYLKGGVRGSFGFSTLLDPNGTKLRTLFRKELTPSDVSKLNRLVIPKKHAVKHFPVICNLEEKNGSGDVSDIELMFFDSSTRSWKFRYCYWKSSQSFVFTRGWNKFVKEKGLRAKDTVIFSAYGREERVCIIDVSYNEEDRRVEAGLELEIGQPSNRIEIMETEDDSVENVNQNSEVSRVENVGQDVLVSAQKGFKLFGVQMI